MILCDKRILGDLIWIQYCRIEMKPKIPFPDPQLKWFFQRYFLDLIQDGKLDFCKRPEYIKSYNTEVYWAPVGKNYRDSWTITIIGIHVKKIRDNKKSNKNNKNVKRLKKNNFYRIKKISPYCDI